MRHYIICIFLFTAIGTQAQQINPVPDYVFRNQMSVGRNAVTDTAAYISIGPRYGANKGLMPPIVSDTAAITGVKRNGLLIFSVQRNNFQYWDSINSRWTSVTANVDTTVISTRAWRKKGDDSLGAVIATRTDTTLLSTRAWRKKGDDSLGTVIATRTDTTLLSTRAWRQKGLDSLAAIEIDGSGTVNYVSKFTAARTLGNSQIFDNGTNIGIAQASPTILLQIGAGSSGSTPNGAGGTFNPQVQHSVTSGVAGISAMVNDGTNNRRAALFVDQTNAVWGLSQIETSGSIPFVIRNSGGERLRITSAGYVGIGSTTPNQALTIDRPSGNEAAITIRANGNTSTDEIYLGQTTASTAFLINRSNQNFLFGTNNTERLRIFANGRVGINTTTDAGYQFDVTGSIRNTTGANFATSSGEVLIGTTTDAGAYALQVTGNIYNTNDAYFGVSSGRLGVGTSTGAGKISSIQSGLVSPTNAAYWLSHETSAASTDGLAIGTNGSASYKWVQSYNGPLSINSAGNDVLIGTTTDAGDYRLQVNGNANFRDDVLIDTNLRVNRHISLDQTPKAWALGNAIEGPQGSTLFVAGGGVQTLANIYYDGSYKYSTSNPGAAMFLLQSGITFATYGSGTANGALTGANEMVYAGGELRVGIADQGTFKLQVADKSYFGDEVQIASTTDLGNYKLQVTGEAIITAGIRTDAPSGGTAATWKLGTVATVSPTSPNRTIEVEIGGTTYYIHAKTTNN